MAAAMILMPALLAAVAATQKIVYLQQKVTLLVFQLVAEDHPASQLHVLVEALVQFLVAAVMEAKPDVLALLVEAAVAADILKLYLLAPT